MKTFKKIFNAIESNTNGKWSDWSNVQHVIDTYDIINEDITDTQLDILERLIKNDGLFKDQIYQSLRNISDYKNYSMLFS